MTTKTKNTISWSLAGVVASYSSVVLSANSQEVQMLSKWQKELD